MHSTSRCSARNRLNARTLTFKLAIRSLEDGVHYRRSLKHAVDALLAAGGRDVRKIFLNLAYRSDYFRIDNHFPTPSALESVIHILVGC
jgi:hypothetical protein